MPSNLTNETHLHITKFTVARLIMAEVPHKKFLRMSNYQTSSNPRIFFFNNAPQSTVAVNEKRKIFSFLTPSSKLMHPLRQFCVCFVRLVLACTVAYFVFAGTPV